MADRKNPLGPTGDTVRQNIRRLREGQNLSFAELSRRLEQVGRPIPELGLSRIERGERRVDADDLLALAVVLRVTPTQLLLPQIETQSEADTASIEVTGLGHVSDREAWAWAGGSGAEFAQVESFVEEMMAEAKRRINDASARADAIDAESEARIQKIRDDALRRAESLERKAAKLHAQAFGKLEAEQERIVGLVENLRTFEREYRRRLRAYVESNAADPGAPPEFIEFTRRIRERLDAEDAAPRNDAVAPKDEVAFTE